MIDANQLDYWVRSHEIQAQGVIAELVGRLVAAAIRNPNDRRFPQGDVINQPGEDGHRPPPSLKTDGFDIDT